MAENGFFSTNRDGAAEAEARIDDLEATLSDRDAKLRAAVALYENGKLELPRIKERIQRESDNEMHVWKTKVLTGFLDVADDIGRALKASSGDPAISHGLELVAAQFTEKLRALGVREIPPGQRFDPRLHEAVAVQEVASPDDDGAILEVTAPGYFLDDRVLRPARVVVGAAR